MLGEQIKCSSCGRIEDMDVVIQEKRNLHMPKGWTQVMVSGAGPKDTNYAFCAKTCAPYFNKLMAALMSAKKGEGQSNDGVDHISS